MTQILASNRTLLPGQRDLVPGYVVVEEDRVVETGLGEPPAGTTVETASILAPGFVDVHSHGGGTHAFDEGIDGARAVLATHLKHGTTTMIGSLVTAGIDDLKAQVAALAPLVESGELAGVHLEGPWLSKHKKGAHTESLLVNPDPAVVADLLSSGIVKMVTVAPELDGALDSIAVMSAIGCVAAVGHTVADYQTTQRAIAAGATGATHLFNGMPEMEHRAPGPILALAQAPEVWLEMVFDGVHVAAPLAVEVLREFPDRAVLVTDAMAAADAPDGNYTLGGLDVIVKDQVARLAVGDSIAGSTLTLERAIRTAVNAGVSPVTALRAATVNPATYLSLPQVGSFAPGNFADAVLLTEDLQVTRVMRRGAWL
jgi:N-acetylglucosamine-6-phosphate deacetylase